MNTVMPTTIRMPSGIWCRVWPTLWRTEGTGGTDWFHPVKFSDTDGWILSGQWTCQSHPSDSTALAWENKTDFRAFRFHERTGSSLYAETGRFDYQTHLRRWQTDSGFYPWRWWSGEDITHNIPAFLNVPLTIPHKERLVITGESFIPTNDFERLKDTLRDGNGKPYKTDVILLPDQYEVLIRRTVSDVVFAFFRSMY